MRLKVGENTNPDAKKTQTIFFLNVIFFFGIQIFKCEQCCVFVLSPSKPTLHFNECISLCFCALHGQGLLIQECDEVTGVETSHLLQCQLPGGSSVYSENTREISTGYFVWYNPSEKPL